MNINLLDLNNDILNIICDYVKKDNLMNKILDVVEEIKQNIIIDKEKILQKGNIIQL